MDAHGQETLQKNGMEHQQTTEYPDNFSFPPEHRGVYQASAIIVVVEIVLRFKSILPPEDRRDLH